MPSLYTISDINLPRKGCTEALSYQSTVRILLVLTPVGASIVSCRVLA